MLCRVAHVTVLTTAAAPACFKIILQQVLFYLDSAASIYRAAGLFQYRHIHVLLEMDKPISSGSLVSSLLLLVFRFDASRLMRWALRTAFRA